MHPIRGQAGTTVAAVSLIVGTSTAVWKAVEVTHQHNMAQRAAQKSQRVTGFLRWILASADPREADADLTIREALDREGGWQMGVRGVGC